jgi:hypothetical protein
LFAHFPPTAEAGLDEGAVPVPLSLTYALLHFASCQSNADEYDVEQQTKAGKENKAYVSESGTGTAPSSRPASAVGGKWANNYVPYGEYPKGLKDEAVNGTNAGIEKTDAEKNGGEKWRKNYVPYEEE